MNQNLETIKSIFKDQDINESVIWDVYKANHNKLPETVDAILNMTKDPKEDQDKKLQKEIEEYEKTQHQKEKTLGKLTDQNKTLHVAGSIPQRVVLQTSNKNVLPVDETLDTKFRAPSSRIEPTIISKNSTLEPNIEFTKDNGSSSSLPSNNSSTSSSNRSLLFNIVENYDNDVKKTAIKQNDLRHSSENSNISTKIDPISKYSSYFQSSQDSTYSTTNNAVPTDTVQTSVDNVSQVPPAYTFISTTSISDSSAPTSGQQAPSEPPSTVQSLRTSANSLNFSNLQSAADLLTNPASLNAITNEILSFIPTSIMKKVFPGTGSSNYDQEKGLQNGTGENNCFLNVVIQSLWHLKSFAMQFLECQNHFHSDKIDETTCVFCALKVLFIQFEFSEVAEIPPTALREAMSQIFRSQERFQLGELDDAAEAHDALMTLLHNSLTNEHTKALEKTSKLDHLVCVQSPCFVHQVFCMHIIEYTKCECGQRNTPFLFQEFIHYVSADALRKEASQNYSATSDGSITCTLPFGQIIKKVHHADERICKKENCGRRVSVQYSLTTNPKIISIGIAWSSDCPGVDFIFEILDMIKSELYLSDMFDNISCNKKYIFKGMIGYYGKHYNAYFQSKSNKEWLVFDDTSVKRVGPKWNDVVSRCRDGRFQPFILWFEEDVNKV